MSDLILFRSALRDLTRPKRLIAASVLIALPTAIALLWRRFASAADYNADVVYNTLSAFLIFGFLLVILAVVFGTSVISQEIEQKTIVYLLTRPVPRWRIVLTKFAAAIVAITATLWIATALLALVAYGFGGARERAGLLRQGDIKDVRGLAKRLREGRDPLSQFLETKLLLDHSAMALEGMNILIAPQSKEETDADLEKQLVDGLNTIIQSDEPLYDSERFAGVHLSAATRRLVEEKPTGKALSRLNRVLLVEAYPGDISPAPTVAGQLERDFLILLVGALAYGAMFLLLATIMSRPLLWGLLFAFGWESWVPNWPGSFQKVSLIAYLRVLSPHPKPETPDPGLSGLFGVLNPDAISMQLAWTVLLSVIVFSTLGALLIFSTREYVPREDTG